MSDTLDNIAQFTPEQRLSYLVKECISNKQVWILTDQDGCVMLNTEDEDCTPVWPSEAFDKLGQRVIGLNVNLRRLI